jgi:hypothetical protein
MLCNKCNLLYVKSHGETEGKATTRDLLLYNKFLNLNYFIYYMPYL